MRKKIKIIELVVIIVLLTAFYTPSSLGIYKNNTGDTGSLGAAAWNVSLNQTGINNSVTAVEGSTNGSYLLKIVSESEVDTAYSITVSGIPSGVDVSLSGYNNGAFQTPVSGSTTFTNAGVINYTGQREEVTRTLTFRANSGATHVNNQSVSINVEFVQN